MLSYPTALPTVLLSALFLLFTLYLTPLLSLPSFLSIFLTSFLSPFSLAPRSVLRSMKASEFTEILLPHNCVLRDAISQITVPLKKRSRALRSKLVAKGDVT